ncbi:MAG: hypothetical protein KKG33_15475 [candidate division Zixibacteria bacterium]|nr:hypothetical protein [candidate division Zixibacteria bacterium]MBU1469931.1 hypothetical protein [candidate division Zixibacteria bacterium]MBU2626950.1 hypothetical protein [candidate division Zixibacteria bacterium]
MMRRWFRNRKSILSDFVTGVGLFWLVVEIASYSTDGKTDSLAKSVAFFLIASVVIVIIALAKNRPKTSFTYQLRDKDNIVEVRVGDAFDNAGTLVIPVNNCFDVCMGGNVMKARSLLSKMIAVYYSDKEAHLANDISKKTDCTRAHDIGTTIEVEQRNKKFYLLASSKKKTNNRVESTVDDVLLSISKLWEYIALESGRDAAVTIPLIGTNHGRIHDLTRSTIVKEIIHSYIEASKRLSICDKLIISILPSDLKKGNIDLDEIDEYLEYSCKHYRKVTLATKPEGEEVSGSSVAHLDN